jgi:hypothetical protein
VAQEDQAMFEFDDHGARLKACRPARHDPIPCRRP